MDVKDILESKDRLIAQCDYHIELLTKEYSDVKYCNELKKLLQSKKKLLSSIKTKNCECSIHRIENIDKKIYICYHIIDNNLKYYNKIKFRTNFINILIKNNEFNFYNIIKIGINYKFIATLIFFTIGIFIFGKYFIEIDYFPNLNRENFIYYIILFSINIILFSILFMIYPIILYIVIAPLFKNKWISEKKIFSVALIFILPSIVYLLSLKIDNWIGISLFILTSILAGLYISTNTFNIKNIKIIICYIFYIFIIFILIIVPIFCMNQILILINIEFYKILLLNFLVLLIFYTTISAAINSILIEKVLVLVLITIPSLIASVSSFPLIIHLLHFGNYTPDALILDPKAKAIIPANFLDANNTLKKPKVLSNMGDEYYIELKISDKKTLHLSIPKNLILSEQTQKEEESDESKDMKNQTAAIK
ncbi:hypothetical protein BKH42_00365 [Helicobacter sp. 13S00482-2]|uniref:hypothetical protein n=1 Tax=Helicobacter sp. 13S00482-2 TaxID=1476200 RepID=UPI000BA79930|nr:hypothetical protein [Helicobacter sp. 13S00482-2]PAF54405.1 hypothetical protein BKH42_00365 [Helicobacter sp. 13S00482-2]